MARLWSCGAELQSATSGIEWDTTTGTVSISTSVKRSGAASIRCNPVAGTGYISHRVRTDGTGLICYRFYLRVASLPATDTTIFAHSDGSALYPRIRLKSTGVLQVANSSNTYVGSASSTLSLDTWYRVELSYADAAGDVADAYLDGVQFCTAAAVEDMAGGGLFRLGAGVDGTAILCDLYFDDIAVNDSTGSAQTSFPGAGSIVHMYPDAAGDNNGWLKQGGGAASSTNYQDCDEVTPDDAGTYLKRTGTGTFTDDYNCQTSASAGIGAGDTITLVQVGQRAGATSATSTGRSDTLRVKSQASGTVVSSGTVDISVNGWLTHNDGTPKVYQLTSYVDPQAGGSWTPALLDAMQVGFVNAVSSANEIRVSTIWALVEYVPASAAEITGTVAATLGALTSTVAGTPTVLGSVSAPLGALTATITGTPTVPGTAACPLGALTATVAGVTFVTGSVAATLGALTVAVMGTRAAAGTVSAPLGGLTAQVSGHRDWAGAVAVDLGGLTATVAGARTILGSVAVTLGSLTSTVGGGPTETGAVSADLGALAAVVAGSVAVTATVAAPLGQLTVTLAGTSSITGVVTVGLGVLVATVTGGGGPPGAVSADLGGLTATVAGSVLVAGSVSAPLGTLIATATGVRSTTGEISAPLGSLAATIGSAGGGAVGATLGALVATAAGTRTITGATTVILGGLACTVSGTRAATATVTATLGALMVTTVGTVSHGAAVAGTLGGLTATVTATVSVSGTVSVPLGALSAAAGGAAAVSGAVAAQLGALMVTLSGASALTGEITATLGALVATVTGVGSQPAIPDRGWSSLLSIITEARELRATELATVPVACPHDGEPLVADAHGDIGCSFDGWTPRPRPIPVRPLSPATLEPEVLDDNRGWQ